MSKTLIIDSRMYRQSKEKLLSMGYKLIEITSQSFLDEPVSGHPDMFITKLDGKTFIDTAIHDLFTFVPERRIEQISAFSENEIAKYPNDVKFNCAVVGNKIICNENYVAEQIMNYAAVNAYKIIHTNQGYAKCSTVIVDNNAVITEDNSIESACINSGIDVLKIDKGFIKLNGYDYGFIGGSCGLIENNILAFNGCIEAHPQYNKIKTFCKNRGVEPVSLCNLPLYDVGSIIRL